MLGTIVLKNLQFPDPPEPVDQASVNRWLAIFGEGDVAYEDLPQREEVRIEQEIPSTPIDQPDELEFIVGEELSTRQRAVFRAVIEDGPYRGAYVLKSSLEGETGVPDRSGDDQQRREHSVLSTVATYEGPRQLNRLVVKGAEQIGDKWRGWYAVPDRGEPLEKGGGTLPVDSKGTQGQKERRRNLTRLRPIETLDMIRDVAVALQFFDNHNLGPHRDIKPANISREVFLNILLDYGCMGPLRSGPWGTCDYFAPEIPEERQNFQTDQFALGISAIEVLTGKHPYAKAAEAECRARGTVRVQLYTGELAMTVKPDQKAMMIFQEFAQQYDSHDAPSAPNPLRKVIQRMTAKDPSERYKSPTELIQAVDDAKVELQLSLSGAVKIGIERGDHRFPYKVFRRGDVLAAQYDLAGMSKTKS